MLFKQIEITHIISIIKVNHICDPLRPSIVIQTIIIVRFIKKLQQKKICFKRKLTFN